MTNRKLELFDSVDEFQMLFPEATQVMLKQMPDLRRYCSGLNKQESQNIMQGMFLCMMNVTYALNKLGPEELHAFMSRYFSDFDFDFTRALDGDVAHLKNQSEFYQSKDPDALPALVANPDPDLPTSFEFQIMPMGDVS